MNTERAPKVTPVGDQQPIEAFGANRPHESFRDAVRQRRLNRRAHNTNACALKHLIETSCEFAIVIPNQQANRLRAFGERPRDLTCLLRDPRAVGMGAAAGEVHAPRGHFERTRRTTVAARPCRR